jgi:formylglycine-generating enzyme required for sulfatase activity
VDPFECSKFKITNEQYLDFLLDGGYQTREYWSAEGWEWVTFKQAKHPLFWVCPLNCKSGCGGEISAYSHCQEKFMDTRQLEFFNSGDRLSHKFKDVNIFDLNGNEKIDQFPYRLVK